MQPATINQAYSIYNRLSLEDKEELLRLIEKQIIDDRRKAINKRAKEAKENLKKGDVVRGDVDEVLEFLDND